MSKYILSLFFKTNLSAFRSAILTNDTNRLCRILDMEREHLSKELDTSGNTALLLAIRYATPLTVRVLLEQGAHPDQTNAITFQTPLSLLASKVYENDHTQEIKMAIEMAKLLLDHGAYVDKPSPYKFIEENGKEYLIRETPLMTAVRTKNFLMARLFVENKANVNYFDKQTENRPIHFAITNGDVEMFDLLENAGASCRSVVTNAGDTLLHWFCYNKSNDEQMSLLKKLLDTGCDINAENGERRTPLILAAKSNMVNTCYMLLNVGADVNKIDYRGSQAIDLAQSGSECYKLLEQVQQINAQPKRRSDRILWKKHLHSTRTLSQRTSDSAYESHTDENKLNRCSTSEAETLNNSYLCGSDQELDTKYKRMWEKMLQTKQKLRRARDLSLQRTRDSSQQRKRDSSQQRTNDLYLKDDNVAVIL